MSRILIIDDEPQIRHFLRIGLSAKAYDVIEAANGAEGLQQAALEAPQLVVLDLGLPDMDGIDVLKSLREFYQGPVIILSVRNREQEKVAALDGGANDYVVKPFGINELLARIRVLLRASGQPDSVFAAYDDGALQVDLLQRRVTVDGKPIRLSRKEFDLLKLLIEFQDRVITQQQILDRLWGKSHVQDTHYLRILVGKLRAKLGDDASAPRFIETEPGVGYRFLSASSP
ncbi:MAG: response regulator transcription factor [Proteobacteria bacterium]|nr:response regulator transcription factor [Pseudomonadota bacterium]